MIENRHQVVFKFSCRRRTTSGLRGIIQDEYAFVCAFILRRWRLPVGGSRVFVKHLLLGRYGSEVPLLRHQRRSLLDCGGLALASREATEPSRVGDAFIHLPGREVILQGGRFGLLLSLLRAWTDLLDRNWLGRTWLALHLLPWQLVLTPSTLHDFNCQRDGAMRRRYHRNRNRSLVDARALSSDDAVHLLLVFNLWWGEVFNESCTPPSELVCFVAEEILPFVVIGRMVNDC